MLVYSQFMMNVRKASVISYET